jgi:hypothetical protein
MKVGGQLNVPASIKPGINSNLSVALSFLFYIPKGSKPNELHQTGDLHGPYETLVVEPQSYTIQHFAQ